MNGVVVVLTQADVLGHLVTRGVGVVWHWLTEATPAPPGIPNPGGGEAPPGVGDKVTTILKWIAYLASAACVGGILYCSIKMAIAHRRGDDTNVSSLGWVLAACVLIGSASGIVGALI